MSGFDFNKEVVELSFLKPVLIDFWAEWCGPCKILGPVLEELERESKGKWALVKINTEEEQEIAAYFRIQSIPSCKLVHEGKIIDEFQGAQTKTVIKNWLEKHLSDLLVEEAEVLTDDFETIISTQDQIPDKEFMLKVQDFLKGNSDHELANLTYAKHELFYNPSSVIDRLKKLNEYNNAQQLIPHFELVKEFLQNTYDEKSETEKDLIKIKTALLNKNGQEAIDLIIQILHKDRAFDDEIARRLGIALFTIWGTQYSLTKENRKLFDMAIW